MLFYEPGDGFVTAHKIPVKTPLRWLTKAKMFLTLSFCYGGVQNMLRQKNIWNSCFKQKCADVLVEKT